MTGAACMRTDAIDIRSFFHGFALGAAIGAIGYLAATDWVFAFLDCHIVFSSIEILTILVSRTQQALCLIPVAAFPCLRGASI